MAARYRSARGQREIAFFTRTGIAGAVFLLSTSSIAFQDVASLIVGDAAPGQRWQVAVVAGERGERIAVGAGGQTFALAPTDATATNAAARGAVAINREGKSDALPVARGRVGVAAAFGAGVLGRSGGFLDPGLDRGATHLAFASPAAAPLGAAGPVPLAPAPGDAPVALVAALPLAIGPTVDKGANSPGAHLRNPGAMAAPSATVAADAPVQLAALTPAAGTPAARAYADEGNLDDVNAPFRAMMEAPGMALPRAKPDYTPPTQPSGIGDHAWVTNPIPASARSNAEVKCMAEAIYFEARGEPVRGQMAVAQVVVNRLKNPAYPATICGVVYQNRQMRNACQFSFACDGVPDVVRERDHWNTAQRIARSILFGEAEWLVEVGSATHYHANYVRPNWAGQMIRMTRIGHHIFYKTRGGGWI